ncbi:MAG: hypothetical protein Q8P31_11320 [Bacillota bacterium]|nr:hypothetical protein [Bacillota bacterium]
MSAPRGGVLDAELGSVLTRVVSLDAIDPGARVEESTPTTVYPPMADPGIGFSAALAAARAQGGEMEPGVALVHLHGLPRSAVFGLAGLPTTELSRQAALRRAGSAVVQVRSTDPASLEGQLIEVRARPLDLLIFTVAARQAAERLMSGGGPRPRALPVMQALYNGPDGEYAALAEVLGGGVQLKRLPPLRTEANVVDVGPTEAALSALTSEILAADAQLAAVRREGFRLFTFASAFTAATETLGRLWAESRSDTAGPTASRRNYVACAELGGRFTELALAASGGALRYVDDSLGDLVGLPGGEAAGGSRQESVVDLESISAWLPFPMQPAELADALANYLRRPFAFPATWGQLMLLAALGRLRLQRAWAESRSLLSGDWRSAAGALVVGGGYFRHLPGPALALALVLDGLQPLGVTEVYCDRAGLVPLDAAAGKLTVWPDERWVPRLATVVAPSNLRLDWRRPHEDDLLALVTVERQSSPKTTFRVVPGSLIRFPLRSGERAHLGVHPVREHDFGAGPGKPWTGEVTGGRCGLVFDARGRPVSLPRDPEVRRSKLLEWLNTLDIATGWGDGR